MWCPCERWIHTYIHCSVSWSPIWCIYVSLVHWYTLLLTRIWMITYWTWYPFWTPIITTLPLLMKLIFIILKHSVFILIYLCAQNTVMFLCKYMLISPCLVLRIYSWACTKSCFFKNITFNVWNSSLCCWVVKWMIRQNVCGQSTLNYSSLFIVHEASVLMRHIESFALFLCLSVGHPIFLSFVIRNQLI